MVNSLFLTHIRGLLMPIGRPLSYILYARILEGPALRYTWINVVSAPGRVTDALYLFLLLISRLYLFLYGLVLPRVGRFEVLWKLSCWVPDRLFELPLFEAC